jgi:hypothetical protein
MHRNKNEIEINTMTYVTKRPHSNYARTRAVTARSNMTAMTSIVKHTHENSLVTLAQDFASRTSNRSENHQAFSLSLLKNKSLLVPTRLALKRQRAALKDRSLQYEPIQSDVFQIELGNPDEVLTQKSEDDRHSSDYHRIKSTSSPSREDTPRTLPTDISLMYRYNTAILFLAILFFLPERKKTV